MLLDRIDEHGKLAWIGLTILSFWLAWPIGMLLLAYLVGSGRVRAWQAEFASPGAWFNLGVGGGNAAKPTWSGRHASPSGNKAFDDYRDATLSGLEEQQREFQAFLDRLRRARDQAEFDAFLAEQRQNSGPRNGTEQAKAS